MEPVIQNTGNPLNLNLEAQENYFEAKQLRQAYVFINTENELHDAALKDLRQIEGVSEVYPSKGAYEIIAKVNGESLDALRELVFRRIRNLSTIKSTLTLMII